MQKQVEYSDAIKTKYPEQVVIAIAKDKKGKANPVTLGWTMIVSGNPPMMAIAVAKKHYSIEAVTHSKCFTIAFPSLDMADAALFFGSKSFIFRFKVRPGHRQIRRVRLQNRTSKRH